MKKILLSLLAIMMVFVFVACENPAAGKGDTGTNQNTTTDTNTENNAGDAEKECTVTVNPEEFAISAGTWENTGYVVFETEESTNYNGGVKIYKIDGTDPDSIVEITLTSMYSSMKFKSKEAYEAYLLDESNQLPEGIIKDEENLTLTLNSTQEELNEMKEKTTYKEFCCSWNEYEIKTNSDKTMYTLIGKELVEDGNVEFLEKNVFIKL